MTAPPARRAAPSVDASVSIGSARFGAVIGMSLLIMIGFGVIVPALPYFTQRFGAEEAGIGLVVFAFSLTRLFGDLFAGALIDRYGERAMTAAGAAIVGISSLAAGAAQSFTQLVLLRGIGGFGSAFFLGGLMAYLIGATPAEQRGRAMSIFQASFGLGFLIGPLLGGLIVAAASPRVAFYVYGVVCLVCVPLCLRAVQNLRTHDILDEPLTGAGTLVEQHPPAPRARAWSKMRPLLRSPAYRAALAASAVAFLIGQAQFTLVPSFWEEALGRARGSSGVPFAVASLVGLAVVWHAGAVTDRRGRRSALVPALAVLAIATSVMGVLQSAWVFVALMAVSGAATGYMRPGPSAIVGDVSTPETRSVAVSGYRIAADLGALVGPLVAGPLAEFVGWGWAFAAIGIFAAIAFVLALVADETAPARR